MNTVTFDIDSTIKITANAADTHYIVNEGVDIAPPSDIAFDATSGATGQSFEINGHLSGTDGIRMGAYLVDTAHSEVVVGLTGDISATGMGILLYGDHDQVINHGKISANLGI